MEWFLKVLHLTHRVGEGSPSHAAPPRSYSPFEEPQPSDLARSLSGHSTQPSGKQVGCEELQQEAMRSLSSPLLLELLGGTNSIDLQLH